MKTLHCTIAIVLALMAASVRGEAGSAEGKWRTIDDETGKARSVVELRREGDELTGRVVELFDPPEPNPVCEVCEGERKNQPIEGMVILWGLTRDGSVWNNGKVLDPESGKIYSASVKVLDSGASLELRGFMGVSWLGRTQVWERVE